MKKVLIFSGLFFLGVTATLFSQTSNSKLTCYAHKTLSSFIPHYVDVLVPWFRNEIKVDKDHIITNTDEGWPIVVNKHDRCVCLSIRLCGQWERYTHKAILNFINEGDTVIEVGANYGIHLVSMAKAVGQKGQVIAYEANPYVYDALRRTISLNNLENVTCKNYAIGLHASTAVLHFNYQNIGGGHVDFSDSKAKNSQFSKIVKVKSLDEDTEGLSNVSLLRMDIEGSEGLALYGAEKLIDRSPNLKIVLEWSPEQLKRNSKPSEILHYLEKKKFRYYYIIARQGRIIGELSIKEISKEKLLQIKFADVLITREPYHYH